MGSRLCLRVHGAECTSESEWVRSWVRSCPLRTGPGSPSVVAGLGLGAVSAAVSATVRRPTLRSTQRHRSRSPLGHRRLEESRHRPSPQPQLPRRRGFRCPTASDRRGLGTCDDVHAGSLTTSVCGHVRSGHLAARRRGRVIVWTGSGGGGVDDVSAFRQPPGPGYHCERVRRFLAFGMISPWPRHEPRRRLPDLDPGGALIVVLTPTIALIAFRRSIGVMNAAAGLVIWCLDRM